VGLELEEGGGIHSGSAVCGWAWSWRREEAENLAMALAVVVAAIAHTENGIGAVGARRGEARRGSVGVGVARIWLAF